MNAHPLLPVFAQKNRPLRGRHRAAWLAKSSGEEGKLFYIDDGLACPVVVGVL